MSNTTPRFRRNLFEIENARNLTRDQVVQTFVPVQAFWRLLSAKHHILLGSRGSGKTAVARMLSHDHLSRLEEPRAKQAIESQAYIGIYVPTRLKWVSALKNKPWQSDAEKEESFQWGLNLASCLAFLTTIESCLKSYIPDRGARARAERELCYELSNAWAEDKKPRVTLDALCQQLEAIEYNKQKQCARLRVTGRPTSQEAPIGVTFGMELFAPLRHGIQLATRVLKLLPDAAWLMCLDEAEFLEKEHQRIINSYMRAFTGNFFFKITTMPYCHIASETNTAVPLEPGHDFEYVYLDRDPVFLATTATERGRIGTQFARTLFSKRAAASGPRFTSLSLRGLLGPSELLDPRTEDWTGDSDNMRLLQEYASRATVERARRLQGTRRFMPEIGLKIHGALVLRHWVSSLRGRGNLEAYCGASMAMRCADANPRRLIRIFNKMLLAAQWRQVQDGIRTAQRIPASKQTEVLIQFADQTLAAVQSEEKCGRELYEFLEMIGTYMHDCLYKRPLTTDQVSSVSLTGRISDHDWLMVQRAVWLGLLYPNVKPSSPDELPVRKGTFHLAYVLAPHFRLLPRRGKSRALSTIQDAWSSGTGVHAFIQKDHDGQMRMFPDTVIEEDS